MPDHSKIRKVSLEEVLRLKRLERPELAFWDQFEKQLREKQLAAIVAKRPWWQLDFGRVMAGVARARVPVGAAAVLTLTFLVVREYRAPKPAVDQPSAAEGLVSATSVVPETMGELANATTPVAGSMRSSMDVAAANTAVVSPAVAKVEVPSTVPSPSYASVSGSSDAEDSVMSLNRMVPWVGDALDASAHALVSGVTRSLEPALVKLQEANLDVPSVARSRALKIATASADSLASEEPLAKLAGPANSQRARLATYVTAAFNAENRSSANADHRARERAISRMSDDELYSSVSRISVAGAAGGGLRLNF